MKKLIVITLALFLAMPFFWCGDSGTTTSPDPTPQTRPTPNPSANPTPNPTPAPDGNHCYDDPCFMNNDTGVTIEYLYITEAGYPDWGSDLLGSDVLYDGDYITYWTGNPDGCYWDVKYVISGVDYFIWSLDLCSTYNTDYYIY